MVFSFAGILSKLWLTAVFLICPFYRRDPLEESKKPNLPKLVCGNYVALVLHLISFVVEVGYHWRTVCGRSCHCSVMWNQNRFVVCCAWFIFLLDNLVYPSGRLSVYRTANRYTMSLFCYKNRMSCSSLLNACRWPSLLIQGMDWQNGANWPKRTWL